MSSFSELVVEQAALEWFDALGYSTLNATEIAPDQPNSERQTYADVVLRDRLQKRYFLPLSLQRNPDRLRRYRSQGRHVDG